MGEWDIIVKNRAWYSYLARWYPNDKFPIQVRGILAEFLKTHQDKLQLNAELDSHHQQICEFIHSLKTELQRKQTAQGNDSFVFGQAFCYDIIQAQDSKILFQGIQYALNFEKCAIIHLYQQSTENFPTSGSSPSQHGTTFSETSLAIDTALASISDQDGILNTCLNADQNQQTHGLANTAENLISEMINALQRVHGDILKELTCFKQQQRLVSIGKKSDKCLDKIEDWFQSLVRHYVNLEGKYLKEFEKLCASVGYQPQLLPKEEIVTLRQAMAEVCLVIEKQPDQIIRSLVKGVKLRVLPCWTNESVSISQKDVDLVFVSEETAKAVSERDYNHSAGLPAGAGEKAKLEKQTDGESKPRKIAKKEKSNNTVEFDKLVASNIVRSHARGDIFSERFYIYFRVKVSVNQRGKQETHTLWALSLPITLTTHTTNQDSKAWSFLIWNNACLGQNFGDFHYPDELDWCFLIEVLNEVFLSFGRPLSTTQRTYLREKITTLKEDSGLACQKIRKSDFCSRKFATLNRPEIMSALQLAKVGPTQLISVGEWLYYCVDLLLWKPTKEVDIQSNCRQLGEYWGMGFIVGFMGTEEMEEKLKHEAPGTFIIRFPENVPAFIGLYTKTAEPNGKLIKDIYTKVNFEQHSLEETILTSPQSTRLFSDVGGDRTIERSNAFSYINLGDGGSKMIDRYFQTKWKPCLTSEIEKLLQTPVNEQGQALQVPTPYLPSFQVLHTQGDYGISDNLQALFTNEDESGYDY